MIKRILLEQKTGKKYLVKDTDDDFHTSQGIISSKDLQSKKTEVLSSKKQKFSLIEPNFVDLWENLKRGPQIVLQKDIGLIITKTGINKNSKVVDAGGGSLSLSGYLAHLCKEVTTYEINQSLISTLEYNKKLFGFKNIKIKQGSIYDGIEEKEIDLITLDLAEPWRVLPHAEKALKQGGFLVIYLPNMLQMKTFLDGLSRSKIQLLELEELMERKWKVEQNILRPEYDQLAHTGFLCFCRKI
ncbi:MAG: methyltransferase domain-containing protein [Candidatus Woesearchaeota archaeon]